MIFIVYQVLFQNGKSYIGFTSDLHRRKLEHKSLSGRPKTYFQKALKKYKKCTWKVLYQCNDISLVRKMEKIFIKKYNSNNSNFGYNLTAGGEGVIGLAHTEETKQKIKNAVLPSMQWRKPHENLKKYYQNNPTARSEIMKRVWQTTPELMIKALNNLTGKGKPKKSITLIDKDLNTLKFNSLSEASKVTKIHISALSGLLHKTVKSAKGYRLYEGNI